MLVWETLCKADTLGAQQLGTLADLGFPGHGPIRERLTDVIHAFWREIPDIGTFWTGAYQRLVEDVEVDNFGTLGDRMLLDLLGICEGNEEFSNKGARLVIEYQRLHAETWWRSDRLFHQRVVTYAEFDLQPAGGGFAVRGSRFQQNGYHADQGRATTESLRCTRLPFNANVDRSLCSEFQLLARLCDDIILACKSPALLPDCRGWLWLFVTGAPCLSCIGTMHQFKALLPLITFCVSIGDELEYEAL